LNALKSVRLFGMALSVRSGLLYGKFGCAALMIKTAERSAAITMLHHNSGIVYSELWRSAIFEVRKRERLL
jgi:hypothetical protein